MPLKNEYLSDEWIVEQVVHGDINHFKEIIRRYQGLLYGIGMRFLRNSHEAEDFVQDVVMKSYENLGSYRGKGPFRVWLTRIAYNLGVDRVRGAVVEDDVDNHALVSRGVNPEEDHLQGEIKRVLTEAIQGLPEKYRICLDFFFFWGLTYNEIREITGFPVNTIKSHVLRAKQALRDSLKGTIAEKYNEM